MMQKMNFVQRAQLIGAKRLNWSRIEKSIQSLGHCLCLSIRDLNDEAILRSFNALKVRIYQTSFATDAATDNSIEYIKWLGKASQHVFLRTPAPQFEKFDPILDEYGNIAPFSGPLSFISDLIKSGKRRRSALTYEQARQLSQIGNVPRALPYPSHEQVERSIHKTMEVTQSTFKPNANVLNKYREALGTIIDDYGYETRTSRVHVSLVNKGKYEISASQGGGSKLLVMKTRSYTDRVLEPEVLDSLDGKFDQFGNYLVNPATAALARRFLGYETKQNMKPYSVTPTIGDILYVTPYEIEALWEKTLNTGKRVPTKLGHLLTLTSSMMILEIGDYNNPHKIIHGVLTFETQRNEFIPSAMLKVKAGISIEAGLKCRLTTSGLAAFAHLSQLPANYMRDYLSKDPFVRTGFQESDKLWTVLKAYRTRFSNRES
jgi:hypothetical protein